MNGSYVRGADPRQGQRLSLRSFARSIKGRIVCALVAMGLTTGLLGGYAVQDLKREGALVSEMFDTSLMAINYARAASSDFNAIQAAYARRLLAPDAATRASLDSRIRDLAKDLVDDLSVAVEHARSERAAAAGARVRSAVKAWNDARAGLSDVMPPGEAWHALDNQAAVVEQQIDVLVNDTAGDGFVRRQRADDAVTLAMRVNLMATIGAILTLTLIAILLTRAILRPIARASEAAWRIAEGHLDIVIPPQGAAELGALLSAMNIMRGNIKSSLQSEVTQRRSAETRLADALQSSREGIVVIDGAGKIVLANPQAGACLAGVLPPLGIGDSAAAVLALIQADFDRRRIDKTTLSATHEIQVSGGRWLRTSQNATQDGGVIIVLTDITLLKDQKTALIATNHRFDVALANMSQGLCLYDASQTLQVFNRRFCEIFRLPSSRIAVGMPLNDVIELSLTMGNFSDRTDQRVLDIHTRIANGRAAKTILDLASDRVVAVAHQPLLEGGWVETYEDVTDRLLSEAKIAYMARHDTLTGLPNRLLLAERVEQALGQAGRGEGFALLCLDLDHFKEINDTLGHPVGDALLRAVAERLSSCIREIDSVARLGGDEFAIVQVDLSGPDDATALARRIVETMRVPFDIEGHHLRIGVSIGISMAPGDGTSYGKLLKSADVALYRAKSDGRDTWRFFEQEMDARLQARRSLEIDLRDAIASEAFELYYQPLYDFKRKQIGGFEALLRWTHPSRGIVSPVEFVPVAEDIGLITELGEWALRRACAQAQHWPDGIRVAVNVSPAQFRSGQLGFAVIKALAQSGLSPSRLELEITESVILADTDATLAMLTQIRDLGVKIAMDDFGTGFSSLSYLRRFPFDKVKIDQSFIRDIATKADSSVIVGAIIGLCKSLGMRVTAEGVESRDQLDFLFWNGCSEAQGFYFSKPVPAAEVVAVIGQWAAGADLIENEDLRLLAG